MVLAFMISLRWARCEMSFWFRLTTRKLGGWLDYFLRTLIVEPSTGTDWGGRGPAFFGRDFTEFFFEKLYIPSIFRCTWQNWIQGKICIDKICVFSSWSSNLWKTVGNQKPPFIQYTSEIAWNRWNRLSYRYCSEILLYIWSPKWTNLINVDFLPET